MYGCFEILVCQKSGKRKSSGECFLFCQSSEKTLNFSQKSKSPENTKKCKKAHFSEKVPKNDKKSPTGFFFIAEFREKVENDRNTHLLKGPHCRFSGNPENGETNRGQKTAFFPPEKLFSAPQNRFSRKIYF